MNGTEGTNSSIDMNMLMSFISQGGAAIAGEDSFAAGINPLVQQTVKAKSFQKLVGQLLKDGGKFNMDKESFSIKAPTAALGGGEFDPLARTEAEGGTSALDTGSVTPAPAGGGEASPSNFALMKLLNPSRSPLDISDASLAGLSADDISKALRIKFMSDELKIKQTAAATPDVPKKTSLRKNYEFAVAQGFKGSLTDYQNISETTHMKDYKQAVAGGYAGTFQQWMTEMTKMGATRISLGERRGIEEMKDEVGRSSFFKSPKFRTDAEKIVDDKWRYVYEGADDPVKARNEYIWKEMEKQVKTSYPDVTFGEDTKTGIIGWYDKKGNLVASWQ